MPTYIKLLPQIKGLLAKPKNKCEYINFQIADSLTQENFKVQYTRKAYIFMAAKIIYDFYIHKQMILFVFNPLYNKSGGDKMFELAENRAIGENLSKLINKKYKSVRQFGKEYIKLDGRIADDDETRKMSNRLSQIINGDKSIQIYDLPIFTKLLGVSCEEKIGRS